MFKIWQTQCIKWNETQGLNFSHSLFILLTKCGKTLLLFPRTVAPSQIISLFSLTLINSKKKTNKHIFVWFSPALIKSPLLIRCMRSSTFICSQTEINRSWHLTQLRYLFPKIKSSWSGTEVAASSFGWKTPATHQCAGTVWLMTNTQSHFDSWNFSVFLAFECEQTA